MYICTRRIRLQLRWGYTQDSAVQLGKLWRSSIAPGRLSHRHSFDGANYREPKTRLCTTHAALVAACPRHTPLLARPAPRYHHGHLNEISSILLLILLLYVLS